MRSRFVARALVVTAFFALIAIGVWGILSKGKDDRPPIIVKGGSIDFSGCADMAGKKRWVRDLIGEHWKPDHSQGGDTDAFVVKLVSAGQECKPISLTDCASGDVVSVTYTAMNPATQQKVDTVFTFTKVRYFWFGHREPKLNSPVTLAHPSDNLLTFGQAQQGAITKLVVDGTTCSLPSNPVIRIVPRVSP